MATGKFVWIDLTVDNADEIRDFYADVLGWTFSTYDMGEYNDYVMQAPGSEDGITGICHKRGGNGNIPSVWLNYVSVESVEEAIEKCKARGGKLVDGPRPVGGKAFAVIQDPAGAYLGVIEE